MKKIISFLFVLWMGQGLFAQGHIQVINSGLNYDLVQASITEYSPGTYIIAATAVDSTGNSHIVVVKTDDTGVILWSKEISYVSNSFVGSLIVDSVGHIVLTGYEGGNNGNLPHKDVIVVKLDANGNLVNDITISSGLPVRDHYGLDIVEAPGGYIVAGLVTEPTAGAVKYGIVMFIDTSLSTIVWGRIYESQGTTRKYDSFNHILEVHNHPLGGPLYLLTGSGTTPTEEMMVTNDLINLQGNSVWANGAVGHRWTTPHNVHPGIAASYDASANKFYVVTSGIENWPSILELDNNGSSPKWFWLRSPWGLNHNVNMVNSMWQRFSVGYYVHPNISQGWPMTVNLNSTGNPYSSSWTQYATGIDFNALYNINFDFIVNPFNSTYPYPPFTYFHNQMYYRPKALVENFSSGIKFVAPWVGNSVGIAFINKGDMVPCKQNFIANEDDIGTPATEFNFDSQPYTFAIIGPGANIGSASVLSHIACGSPAPRPFMGTNNPTNKEIEIYPNPASDKLFVSGLRNTKKVELVLYDIQGRKILSQSFEGNTVNQMQLDVSGLQNGIYFLKIFREQKILLVERIVKE